MTAPLVRAAAVVLVALTLATTGCKAKPTAGGTAASATPTSAASASASPSATTVALPSAVATQVDATPGTTVTVIPDPASAPGATEAAATPTSQSAARDKLVEDLTKDTKLAFDPTTAPAIDWVKVYSPDRKLSMDVPSSWPYVSFESNVGGMTWGASVDGLHGGQQERVLHGDRTATLDESIATLTAEAVTKLHCTPATVRPYEDGQFSGKGFAAVCQNDASFVFYAIDGKGAESFYHGYFAFFLKDATGVAAMERAINSLEVA